MEPRPLNNIQVRILASRTKCHPLTIANWAAGLKCHASTHQKIANELVIIDEFKTTIERLLKEEEARSAENIHQRIELMLASAPKPRRDRIAAARERAARAP